MKSKKFTRIVALILALIMLGSVIVVAIQSFATGPKTTLLTNDSSDGNVKAIAKIIVVAAVVVILIGAVLSVVLKKRK
ncbi:MAG: hypothetical protein GX241_02315 [Ruminococcaceae bacterium]|jgi:uncharacterized membrane protein YphA (DoxX/SURF4 family)|nr:hypothetical protein [Oscillospiraceae bacterium]